MRGLWKPVVTFSAIALAATLPALLSGAQGGAVLVPVVLATATPFAILYVAVPSLLLARFRRGLREAGLSFDVVEDEVGWLGGRRQGLRTHRGCWHLEAELYRSGTSFLVRPPGHHEPVSITDDKRETGRCMAERALIGKDPVLPAAPDELGPTARRLATWVRHNRVLFAVGTWTLLAGLHVAGAWARATGAAPPALAEAAYGLGLAGAGVFGLFASLLLLRLFYTEAELQAQTSQLLGPTFALGLGGLTLGAAVAQGIGVWVSGGGEAPVVALGLGAGAVVGGVVSALEDGMVRRMAGTAGAVLAAMGSFHVHGRVLFVPLGVTMAVLAVVLLWSGGTGETEGVQPGVGSAGR